MSVLCRLKGSFFVPDSKSLMDQTPKTSMRSDTTQDVYLLFQHVVSNFLPPLIINLLAAKDLEFHPTHVAAGSAFPYLTSIRSSLPGAKKVAPTED